MLMLALAICASSTVFSWINATLLDPIPGARYTGDLVTIMRGTWNASPSPPFSYPDYRDLRAGNRTFIGILAYHHDWLTLTAPDNPERVYVANITSNYFDVLGIRPALGRFLRPDEEARPGGVPNAVLSYSLWQTRFHADPSILGKSIELARHRLTVIGVAPKGFIGCMTGISTDVWIPLAANTDPGSNDWIVQRGRFWLNVLGRLRQGVTRKQATDDLQSLTHQLVAQYPNDHLGDNNITLDPLWRSPFGANIYLSLTLPYLLSIAGILLLLTCVNIATLALVRFVVRRRELGIRQALGASRFQLMRQMILEGLLVSFAGAALAILLTVWTSKTLASFIPPNASPIALNGYVDMRVIIAILILAIASSFLCGVLPAWRSSRVPAAEILKEESAGVRSSPHNGILLSCLVVAQIALSLALLISSGLFLRTLRNAATADPGFDQAHVLTASVGLSTAGYSPDAVHSFERKVLSELTVMPGVAAASVTDWVPLSLNHKTVENVYRENYVPHLHESLEVAHADVGPGYFDTMRIPVLQGRAFSLDDDETTPVVIIDETAAARYFPRQNPIGQHLRIKRKAFVVIGVVRNTKHLHLDERPEAMIYLSIFQESDPETIFQVRTKGDPADLMPAITRTIRGNNAQVAIFDVRPLKETTQIDLTFQRMRALFATIFGILALVLATTGIYGVVAYRTQLRTHEIGIRVALGAAQLDVLRLVLYQGMRLVAVGLALGLALAFVLTRFLRDTLYGISATDPPTAFCVTALLTFIVLLASFQPALKAIRTNPITAIRTQ
jgi:predicted permease